MLMKSDNISSQLPLHFEPQEVVPDEKDFDFFVKNDLHLRRLFDFSVHRGALLVANRVPFLSQTLLDNSVYL